MELPKGLQETGVMDAQTGYWKLAIVNLQLARGEGLFCPLTGGTLRFDALTILLFPSVNLSH